MSITSMIGELFRPVSNIMDELPDEEGLKFEKVAWLVHYIQFLLDVEKQMVQAKSSIINAEANGQS